MKTGFLFPHRYRLIGWLVFVPALALGLAHLYGGVELAFLTVQLNSGHWPTALENNLTDEVTALGVIAGLMLIGFSKEKVEDEMVSRLRLDALQWSVYVNYLVLSLCILFVYGEGFFEVMTYNLFTVLLVFVVRYRWLMARNSRSVPALAL